jgi:RNA polymerase sigma factor (TIGR02999 family)
MADTPEETVSTLCDAIDKKAKEAQLRLIPAVYEELRQIAKTLLHKERPGHTLQPTALVHEALAKLLGGAALTAVEDSATLTAVAVRAMRQVLIDHARTRKREKRGGHLQRQPLDIIVDQMAERHGDPVVLLEACELLAKLQPRQSQIAQLRLQQFSIPEIAALLGLSVSTIENDLRLARAFLATRLRTATDT